MTLPSPCLAARASLHASLPGLPLPAEAAAHQATCPACAGVAAAYARVDLAIVGLVPPLAPRDLPALVRSAVARRRAADARWARGLSLVLVAAAVMVVVGVTVPLGEPAAPSRWLDAASAAVSGALDEVAAGPATRVGAVLGALADHAGVEATGALPGLPAPQLVLLAALAAPLLLVLNRALGVRHPEVA